jgi:nucleoside 2-deoxyribosyltransferase
VVLAKALDISLKIKELNGGNPWTPAQIAEAIGMGAHSPDFYYVTAASRDFGLTTGSRETATIALTELGREVAYAPSSEIEHAKKAEAFHKVDLFSKVLKHYKGSNLPEMKYLGNTLERDFGLAPEYHEEFSRVFRENCKYLNITAGDAIADSGGGAAAPTTVVLGQPSKKSGIKAFVIMPFVEKTSERQKGFFSEVLASLVTPAAVDAGFNVETANRQGSDVIQSTIVNELLEADLVIADLTDHNPNVLFELGLRMAMEKPVALIKAAGTGRVFDVDNMLRVCEYQPNLWRSTLEADLPELTKHFKAAWDNRTKDTSYMKILRRSAKSEGSA